MEVIRFWSVTSIKYVTINVTEKNKQKNIKRKNKEKVFHTFSAEMEQ